MKSFMVLKYFPAVCKARKIIGVLCRNDLRKRLHDQAL